MKTTDDNWHKLRTEDRTIPEIPNQCMQDADDIKLIRWWDNVKQSKMQWRQHMVRYTAWFTASETHGLWTTDENRIYEEIQADIALDHQLLGYSVIRSTAMSEQAQPMLNAKLIEIKQYDQTREMFLILDRSRILWGIYSQIKRGHQWRFKNSTTLKQVLNRSK